MTRFTGADDARAYATAVLSGAKVRLRGVRDDDLEPLSRWLSDPAVQATLAMSVRPGSQDAARATTQRRSTNEPDDGALGFAVETLPEDAGTPVLVGQIDAFNIPLQARRATLGVLIGPDHIGLGYGTDAVRVMVGYLFREVGLHRVELQVAEFNQAGRRAYAKAGFVEEGRLRDAIFHDGQWYDDIPMAVLEQDWRAQQT